MPKKGVMNECCRIYKKKGMWMLVVGLLVLVNAYLSLLDWSVFVGGILTVAGILKLIMPHKWH